MIKDGGYYYDTIAAIVAINPDAQVTVHKPQEGEETIEWLKGTPEISKADIVVSSITSRTPVIEPEIVNLAIQRRSGKPIFLVDLGVPRNISGKVGSVESAYLYTVDDLKTIVESNVDSRKEAAVEAEQIVTFKVSDYLEWLRIQNVGNVIAAYREQCVELTRPELTSSIRALEDGADPEEIIERLVKTINNKLMHNPTVFLRKYADDPAIFKIATKILGIKKEKV